MKSSKLNMLGVTLLEAILALSVIGIIMMTGTRLYLVLDKDSAAQKVKANVETIMRAAANYYYANCKNMSGMGNTATLDPAANPASPFTVNISDLVTSGYLASMPLDNQLVNSTGANKGYAVQFVRDNPLSTRYHCDSAGCSAIGYNYNWHIQVSVLLTSSATASRYLKMSGATCLTSGNGTKVGTCSTAATFATSCQALRNTPRNPRSIFNANQATANSNGCPPAGGTYNNYLSWERLPSMASPKGQSVMWMTNPTIKQFYQGSTSPSLQDMLANPTTNFLCGS